MHNASTYRYIWRGLLVVQMTSFIVRGKGFWNRLRLYLSSMDLIVLYAKRDSVVSPRRSCFYHIIKFSEGLRKRGLIYPSLFYRLPHLSMPPTSLLLVNHTRTHVHNHLPEITSNSKKSHANNSKTLLVPSSLPSPYWLTIKMTNGYWQVWMISFHIFDTRFEMPALDNASAGGRSRITFHRYSAALLALLLLRYWILCLSYGFLCWFCLEVIANVFFPRMTWRFEKWGRIMYDEDGFYSRAS